ncbi:MAG: thioredoxin [Candidatus Jordarchaeales archaeon]|nr:thioredoxin [Candidatus Jordarchaeia archaeon]
MSGEKDFGEDEELKRIKERKLRELARKRSGRGAPGIVMLDGEGFDEFVSRSSVPVLVDFFAVWCPPCRMMEPVMERLAEEFAGKVAFGKVNVDENMELAARFDVSAVPTFILFKGGKMLGRIVGARDYEDFKEILEEAIKS